MTFRRTFTISVALATVAAAFAPGAYARGLTEAQARAIIEPLYKNFTVPQGDVAENLKNAVTPDWQSCVNDSQCRGVEESTKVFSSFAKTVPDMKLVVKEVIASGNKIVVRGEMTATPAGEFFGVPHTGKSFKVMTIDIHTVVRGGKISYTNHLEDWAGALGQLRAATK